MTAKQTLQPKLRFPEFDGDWEGKKLSDVSDISSGGTPSRSEESFWNGSIPWVSTSLIDFNIICKADEYITEKGLKNSSAKLFPKGSLLMAMYGQGKTRGKISVLGIDASTNQACGVIVPNQLLVNNWFLFQNLSGRYDEIRDLSNQGGQENLSSGIIKDINVFFPFLEEQKKIANFLSSIDEKINLLKEKKALLEEYKKGMMQKIFNQEIRFKDDNGNDFEDWEEKTLGEICVKAQSGGTPKSTNRNYYDGNIPFLSISDMTKQGKFINYTSNKISKDGLKNSSTWVVPVNSIIYSMYASVGFVAINKIPLATSQAVLNLVLNENICIEYVYYFLLDFQKYLAEYITTGTQGNLNAQTVKGFNISLPTYKEQTKIANFLSSIDEKIALVATQIKDTQEYKKGLLQQMFI